jgi:deoxycytidylate deaminase
MIKRYELSYIRTLRNVAKNLDHGLRCKHAAMLTDGNKIISIGVNKAKSDPFQKANSKNYKNPNPHMEYSWTHAETDCLKGINLDFRRTTIYVIRTDDKGNMMESCPCEGCRTLINRLQIPRIIHSTSDGTIAEINNIQPN